jgi:hypothetical protein
MIAASGCSLPISVENLKNAGTAVREGDDATADGDYNDALRSYLKARQLVSAARQDGYGFIADEGKLAAIDEKISELEKTASEEGLVRIGGRYIDGGALGPSLADELWRMFDEGSKGIGTREEVVPEMLDAACGEEKGGRRDIVLSVVIRSTGEEAEFDQDAWSIVRFFMEGAWGHGFSFHIGHLFPQRAWMGTQSGWGVSGMDGAENHYITLKGKIGRLTINVARAPARPKPGDDRGASARRRFEASGPLRRKEPYRSYSIGYAEAEKLNWARANRIPDETLYGLMTIAPGESAMPTATGGVGLHTSAVPAARTGPNERGVQ